MFVLTTNLMDGDLSPFSLAGVGLVCCLSTTAPSLPPQHTHAPELQIYGEWEGHGLWERGNWYNQSIVPWCTADAQFELVDWQTGAGQAISLSGLPFFMVAAFKIRQEQVPSACDLLWGQSPVSKEGRT